VPVRPDAEKDEVEAVRKLDVDRTERMDPVFAHADAPEQGFPREALVRELVAGWDVTLVAPPNVPRLPVQVEPGEALVDETNGRPTRERDPERVTPRRPTGNPARGELG
jgi:hypothetical protein